MQQCFPLTIEIKPDDRLEYFLVDSILQSGTGREHCSLMMCGTLSAAGHAGLRKRPSFENLQPTQPSTRSCMPGALPPRSMAMKTSRRPLPACSLAVLARSAWPLPRPDVSTFCLFMPAGNGSAHPHSSGLLPSLLILTQVILAQQEVHIRAPLRCNGSSVMQQAAPRLEPPKYFPLAVCCCLLMEVASCPTSLQADIAWRTWLSSHNCSR